MKHPARDQIVASLNSILTLELTGINQFFMHARMLKNWGYNRLANIVRKRSIEEMHHDVHEVHCDKMRMPAQSTTVFEMMSYTQKSRFSA